LSRRGGQPGRIGTQPQPRMCVQHHSQSDSASHRSPVGAISSSSETR
jgi:hypothetical protein